MGDLLVHRVYSLNLKEEMILLRFCMEDFVILTGKRTTYLLRRGLELKY